MRSLHVLYQQAWKKEREGKLRLAKNISISNNAALHVSGTKHFIIHEVTRADIWKAHTVYTTVQYTDADFSAFDFWFCF